MHTLEFSILNNPVEFLNTRGAVEQSLMSGFLYCLYLVRHHLIHISGRGL